MTGIIILIILGVLLFVVEFFLIPGVTIAGIGGLVLIVLGVFKAFSDYGTETGIWVLIATILLNIFVIVMSLRARTWKRLMLNTKSDGTVDGVHLNEEVKPGDIGESLTRLAPMGKIRVNNLVREAKSIDGYIDEHKEIEIVEVSGTHLSVKPKKA